MKYRNLFSISTIVFLSLSIFGGVSKANASVSDSSQSLAGEGAEMNDNAAVASIVPLTEKTDTVLRVAIVLSDISANKDNEFTRGFLLGLQQASLPENSVSLKLMNGGVPEDSLYVQLTDYLPHAIFTTYDKECPSAVVNYRNNHFVKIFNVFDAKGEDYKTTPGVYQLLVPSAAFNSDVTSYMRENYGDNTLLIVGNPDGSDQILVDMLVNWPEDKMLLMSAEDFGNFNLEDGENYLIYPVSSEVDDITALVSSIKTGMDKFPFSGVRLIGRPKWIDINNLATILDDTETFVPAKVYFEPASASGKRFITDFRNSYDLFPVKSYPVFAVMGYDSAVYFLPMLTGELRTSIEEWTPGDMLQSYFNIVNESPETGGYNKGAFLLHYLPGGQMKKELMD